MTASFVLDKQIKNKRIDGAIVKQLEEVVQYTPNFQNTSQTPKHLKLL